MCLLVMISGVRPDEPLVVAANRDELLSREAAPTGILRDAGPRVVGGRDLVAGGTWLAVNEHGVVAALTNVPPHLAARDPSRKSRGLLPLLLAEHASADAAVAAFRHSVDPGDYNAAWLMVADGRSIHYLEVLGDHGVRVETLPPGIHVLENRPLHEDSPKVDAVRDAVADAVSLPRRDLIARLSSLLASHEIPTRARANPEAWRPVEAEAPCVHAGPYGTRSSTIVLVGREGPPEVHASDGPPCTSPLRPAHLWL